MSKPSLQSWHRHEGPVLFARDQVDQGGHSDVTDALAHHAVIGLDGKLGKPREFRPEKLFGIEILELGRSARLVFELLRAIALEQQEPARLERLAHARKDACALRWPHELEE